MSISDKPDVKARKEHKCNFCTGTIAVGEVYGSQTNVGDGGIWVWKSHQKCTWLAQTLNMYDHYAGDEGLNGEDFQDSIKDAFDDLWETFEGYIPSKPTFLQKLEIVHQILNKDEQS